jgi:hypothetical protein
MHGDFELNNAYMRTLFSKDMKMGKLYYTNTNAIYPSIVLRDVLFWLDFTRLGQPFGIMYDETYLLFRMSMFVQIFHGHEPLKDIDTC